MNSDNTEPLRERLRAALRPAMRARDSNAIAALRSALGAIDNAEAVAAPDVRAGAAEAAVSLGGAEVPRRELSEAEVATIVRAEIDERYAAAAEYETLGATARRDNLRAEAAALTTSLEAHA